MQRAHAHLYDINPLTGISFEVFYTDRTWNSAGEALVGFGGPTSEGCSPGTARLPDRSLRATQPIGTR
jgi:hypothetical protein